MPKKREFKTKEVAEWHRDYQRSERGSKFWNNVRKVGGMRRKHK